MASSTVQDEKRGHTGPALRPVPLPVQGEHWGVITDKLNRWKVGDIKNNVTLAHMFQQLRYDMSQYNKYQSSTGAEVPKGPVVNIDNVVRMLDDMDKMNDAVKELRDTYVQKYFQYVLDVGETFKNKEIPRYSRHNNKKYFLTTAQCATLIIMSVLCVVPRVFIQDPVSAGKPPPGLYLDNLWDANPNDAHYNDQLIKLNRVFLYANAIIEMIEKDPSYANRVVSYERVIAGQPAITEDPRPLPMPTYLKADPLGNERESEFNIFLDDIGNVGAALSDVQAPLNVEVDLFTKSPEMMILAMSMSPLYSDELAVARGYRPFYGLPDKLTSEPVRIETEDGLTFRTMSVLYSTRLWDTQTRGIQFISDDMVHQSFLHMVVAQLPDYHPKDGSKGPRKQQFLAGCYSTVGTNGDPQLKWLMYVMASAMSGRKPLYYGDSGCFTINENVLGGKVLERYPNFIDLWMALLRVGTGLRPEILKNGLFNVLLSIP